MIEVTLKVLCWMGSSCLFVPLEIAGNMRSYSSLIYVNEKCCLILSTALSSIEGSVLEDVFEGLLVSFLLEEWLILVLT